MRLENLWNEAANLHDARQPRWQVIEVECVTTAIVYRNRNLLVEPYQARMATGYEVLVLQHLYGTMHS